MLIDDDYFYLQFSEGDCALDDTDPSHYAYSTRGGVIAIDDQDNETLAGKFHFYYMDVHAAVNARASVYDIFDCRFETFDYFSATFDPDTLDISAQLTQMFKHHTGWGNLLILNRLEILPRFRGQNLGLMVLQRLIERFGTGAAFVAIKPFPLQQEHHDKKDDGWRSMLQLSDLDKNLRRATAKLCRHYRQLGFKAMRGTPFMFLSTAARLLPPNALEK